MQRRLFSLHPFLPLLLLCCCIHSLQAQETDPISTERPSAGPSADLVSANSLQIETGWGLDLMRGQVAVDLPESLLRFGVLRRLEVRYQSANLVERRAPGKSIPLQTADTATSLKFLLAAVNRPAPRSVIFTVGVPTGSPLQSTGSYDPSLTIIWAQALPHGYSLIEVGQATLTTVDGARRATWSPGISLARTFSYKLAVFGEYAPNLLADRTSNHILDAGLTYARNARFQLDGRIGYIAEPDGAHLIVGAGISRRFDHLLRSPRVPR